MHPLWERLKKINLVKKLIYVLVGTVSYPGLNMINKLKISGTEHIEKLPPEKVLFVSNHQTYFADVICFLHIFGAVKWGKKNKLGIPYYLLNPFTRVFFVAAEETMKSSWITRIFAMAGALKVKRMWNPEATIKRRGLDPSDTRKVIRSLNENWIITFPQGTTRPFAPGRKGTALIIKATKPVVIPVVINGFSTAFDKTGLKMRKKGVNLTVQFKAPLELDFDMSTDDMLEVIMDSIEQSKKFMPVTDQDNAPTT